MTTEITIDHVCVKVSMLFTCSSRYSHTEHGRFFLLSGESAVASNDPADLASMVLPV